MATSEDPEKRRFTETQPRKLTSLGGAFGRTLDKNILQDLGWVDESGQLVVDLESRAEYTVVRAEDGEILEVNFSLEREDEPAPTP